MNETLQQAITDLMNKTIEGVDTSVDFLQAELPTFITELLMWYGVYNFIWFCVAVCLFIFGVWFNRKMFIRMTDDKNAHNLDNNFGLTILGNVVIWISFTFAVNLVWLKIWIAPKVWLVEYAGSLVK